MYWWKHFTPSILTLFFIPFDCLECVVCIKHILQSFLYSSKRLDLVQRNCSILFIKHACVNPAEYMKVGEWKWEVKSPESHWQKREGHLPGKPGIDPSVTDTSVSLQWQELMKYEWWPKRQVESDNKKVRWVSGLWSKIERDLLLNVDMFKEL